MNLAIKLCDTKVTGVHERRKMIEEMKNEINKQSITELANKDSNHVNRYMPGCFPHRSYTYISGEEAYEEVHVLAFPSPSVYVTSFLFQFAQKEKVPPESEVKDAATMNTNIAAASTAFSMTLNKSSEKKKGIVFSCFQSSFRLLTKNICFSK
jgi:hypothetical protein